MVEKVGRRARYADHDGEVHRRRSDQAQVADHDKKMRLDKVSAESGRFSGRLGSRDRSTYLKQESINRFVTNGSAERATLRVAKTRQTARTSHAYYSYKAFAETSRAEDAQSRARALRKGTFQLSALGLRRFVVWRRF